MKEETQAREKQKIAFILLQLRHFFLSQILIIHHSSTCRSLKALEKRAGTIEDMVHAVSSFP